MRVLGFPESLAQSRALASEAGCGHDAVEVHRFPDGECRLRLPETLPERVVLCRSLDHPNDKLVELLLAAETARSLGVRELILVAPYLCYMRQDTAFHPGEAVSQKIVGQFLAGLFDAVVTVDPHLHRVHRLVDAVPAAHAIALSAAGAMGAFLSTRTPRPLIVGPDEESAQWVARVADAAATDFAVARKVRRSDRDVDVQLPSGDYGDREVVLVDDVASTGRTLVGAAQALRSAGAARVDVLVTHALFVDDALDAMARAGVASIWSSDSVPHATNAFPLAGLLASALA
ncbi:MAG TPA: ribose-phosphate diphosphokinase [Pseudomonadales bacterium]|nr:ribose-phosphate diphosphokinase [Pseudomonadales bacterium]